jgi:hypothetical protein
MGLRRGGMNWDWGGGGGCCPVGGQRERVKHYTPGVRVYKVDPHPTQVPRIEIPEPWEGNQWYL